MLLAFVLLLGGCSAKFAYNNVNWLVYWYLDDYVELNNKQEDMFDGMLSNWKTWHKQQELPKYYAQLEDIVSDIKAKNVNEQSIASHRERVREHWARARAHVTPDLVKLGATLSDEQVLYLFANLEKMNVEDEEEINKNRELDKQEQLDDWIKRNQKGMKRWLGRLSDEQEAFIGTFYPRFESTSPFWLQYKRDYQQQLRKVFVVNNRGAGFERDLTALIINPEQFRSVEFQNVMDANTTASTDYLMGIYALSSDKQIQRLLDEVADLKDDLLDLQK